MKDLIAKLESAVEGSRVLDKLIAQAVGYKVETYVVPEDHPVLTGGLEFMVDEGGTRVGIPPFSRSLDAARTLVGDDKWFRLQTRGFAPENVGHRLCEAVVFDEKGEHRAGGKTPALALTIAALKAREK